MMSYRNGFVVAVLQNGNIMKETQYRNGGPPVVHLPEGSEYGIRLRNKNSRRAVGEILIDGESQGEFVIEAQHYIDLFRPANKDCAFKLVSINSAEAVDYGKNQEDRDSGVIEVRFRLEKAYHYVKPIVYPVIRKRTPWPTQPQPMWNASYKSEFSTDSLRMNSPEGEVYCCGGPIGDIPVVASIGNIGDIGVTVEGAATGQRFVTVDIDLEPVVTVVQVALRVATSQFANGAIGLENKYCDQCGAKRKRSASKFCDMCSNKF